MTTNFVANRERQRGRRLNSNEDDDSWPGRCFACRRQADAKTRRVFTNFLNLQRTLSLNRRRPKIHQKFWTHTKKKLAQHVAWCSFSNDRSRNALPNEVDSFQASIVPVAHVRLSLGSLLGLEWNFSDYFRPNIWQDLSNEAKTCLLIFNLYLNWWPNMVNPKSRDALWRRFIHFPLFTLCIVLNVSFEVCFSSPPSWECLCWEECHSNAVSSGQPLQRSSFYTITCDICRRTHIYMSLLIYLERKSLEMPIEEKGQKVVPLQFLTTKYD